MGVDVLFEDEDPTNVLFAGADGFVESVELDTGRAPALVGLLVVELDFEATFGGGRGEAWVFPLLNDEGDVVGLFLVSVAPFF